MFNFVHILHTVLCNVVQHSAVAHKTPAESYMHSLIELTGSSNIGRVLVC